MRGNVVMVAVTAVLGTTNVSVLSVLGSGVFAVSGTQAPLSRDTEDLISFGGVASVLFEDVPQVCFFFSILIFCLPECQFCLRHPPPLFLSPPTLISAGCCVRVPGTRPSARKGCGSAHDSGKCRERSHGPLPPSRALLRAWSRRRRRRQR